MAAKNEFSISELVCAISEAADLVSPVLGSHHKKVSSIAGSIAREMNLPSYYIQDIVLAAMLHDIGAFTIGERVKTLAFQSCENGMDRHSLLGYQLLKNFRPLARAAVLIQYHHADYDASRDEVPLGSYILHLADRAAILFNDRREVLEQIPEITQKVIEIHHRFHPGVLAAFLRLSKLEYVWLGAFLPPHGAVLMRKRQVTAETMELETLRDFAKVIARIIDFRSRFTATHSSGVAAVARELTRLSGFSGRECDLMEIAGLLHDLGKLAVPSEILEKSGKLNREEFNVIRKHAYYTYVILSKVNGLEDIATWAAYHHERQDGTGYPFHVSGEDFPRLACVMAVADVLTALTEDRPYRRGMDKEQAMRILFSMAESGAIDLGIVELADKNFFRINSVRAMAQQQAQKDYEAFYRATDQLYTEKAMSA
ncbi:MAG: HD domain-containing protein [Treponema sp.]|jgi:HD-GYP domain-containing protein (c-di-GMP phosphodiesterase class II)|nr:HD domain-containing protein [Treponema sp.]